MLLAFDGKFNLLKCLGVKVHYIVNVLANHFNGFIETFELEFMLTALSEQFFREEVL